MSAFTPVPFPLVSSSEIDVTTATAQLIAPFWGDVDTRSTGTVWHRESTDQADRDRAQREIRRAFPAQAARFTPRLVFIATWDGVGYYNSQIDLVSVIASNSTPLPQQSREIFITVFFYWFLTSIE